MTWVTFLNLLCVSLPILAFASPASVFLPVFCPWFLPRRRQQEQEQQEQQEQDEQQDEQHKQEEDEQNEKHMRKENEDSRARQQQAADHCVEKSGDDSDSDGVEEYKEEVGDVGIIDDIVDVPNDITNNGYDVVDDVTRSSFDKVPPPTRRYIEMAPLALTTQMLQCYLFAIYAHHFEYTTLLLPNVTGFALGLTWSSLYPLRLSPEYSAANTGAHGNLYRQWVWQYCTSLVLMIAGTLTIRSTPYLSSSIAAVVGVAMCTYPLPSFYQSYIRGNPNLLGSRVMNGAMLLCCSAWVIHSSPLVEYDAFVLVSNLAGVLVQSAAFILRAVIAANNKKGLSPAQHALGNDTELTNEPTNTDTHVTAVYRKKQDPPNDRTILNSSTPLIDSELV